MEVILMYWSTMNIMESGIEQKNNLFIPFRIRYYVISFLMDCVGNILDEVELLLYYNHTNTNGSDNGQVKLYNSM